MFLQLAQDLIWPDSPVEYASVSIDGFTNDVIVLVMVMNDVTATARRRRNTIVDQMQEIICSQVRLKLTHYTNVYARACLKVLKLSSAILIPKN